MASTPQIWDGVDDVRLDIRHGRGAGGLLISGFRVQVPGRSPKYGRKTVFCFD